jgi:membrane protein
MKNKLKKYITVDYWKSLAKKQIGHIKIGRMKISLLRFLEILFHKLSTDHVMEMARSMAYSFLLSIFPAIIFLFTLIPYFPIDHLEREVLTYLKQILPESIYEVANVTINDIVSRPHSGLMSFGFLFTMYASVNGIEAMINVFNKCYKTKDNRTFFKRILVSIQILVLLLFSFVVSVAILLFVHYGLTHVQFNSGFELFLVNLVQYMLPYLLLLISFSMIYYLAPAVSKRWKFFSLGSTVGAFLSMLFSVAFILYFNNFSTYNKLYGSIGALIGLMLWINFMSLILLLGFEINAAWDIAKAEKRKEEHTS